MEIMGMTWGRKAAILLALLLVFLMTGCADGEAPSDAGSPHETLESALDTPGSGDNTKPSESHPDEPEPKAPEIVDEPPDHDTAGYYGKLKVQGSELCDMDGNHVQLRGISSQGLSFYPEYVNLNNLMQMRREWGCNVFRLAMYTDDYNGYCSGDDENRERLKKLIDEMIYYAGREQMYIVIDWHILSDSNPLIHMDEALEFFGEMAEKYADEEHVIFEICNEPNGDTSWQDVKAYAQEIISVIREHTDAIILVGTPSWSQDIHLAAEDPITGFDNIMYTLHFYAATHGEYLRDRLIDCVGAGLPVFVSEYGICDASGDGVIDTAEADRWLDTMDICRVSHVMWNLSNKDESSAMILPECEKTTGFESEDLSQSGYWFMSRVSGGIGTRPGLTDTTLFMGKDSIESDLLMISRENSWDNDTTHSYQYKLRVKNASGALARSWSVRVDFNQNIYLQDSWNAVYSAQGSSLTIGSMDYSEGTDWAFTDDIGFILESGEGLAIIAADVQSG